MKPSTVALLALALPGVSLSADPAADERVHTVEISANVPVVAVPPQPTTRHFLDLPTLEYRFQIEPRCETGWQPDSFSLNVADSRVSLTGAELNERDGEPVLLRIPARQIAPVPVAGFCVITGRDEGSVTMQAPGSSPDSRPELDVDGALSAHASLVCVSDDERDITYVTHTLDVLLSCETPNEGAAISGSR